MGQQIQQTDPVFSSTKATSKLIVTGIYESRDRLMMISKTDSNNLYLPGGTVRVTDNIQEQDSRERQGLKQFVFEKSGLFFMPVKPIFVYKGNNETCPIKVYLLIADRSRKTTPGWQRNNEFDAVWMPFRQVFKAPSSLLVLLLH